jgi:hypothetical protein
VVVANRNNAAARLDDRRVRDESILSPEIVLPGARHNHPTAKPYHPTLIVDGLESAPEAFRGLLEGKNLRKLIARVAP